MDQLNQVLFIQMYKQGFKTRAVATSISEMGGSVKLECGGCATLHLPKGHNIKNDDILDCEILYVTKAIVFVCLTRECVEAYGMSNLLKKKTGKVAISIDHTVVVFNDGTHGVMNNTQNLKAEASLECLVLEAGHIHALYRV